jgi:hypothetical protein
MIARRLLSRPAIEGLFALYPAAATTLLRR